MIKPELIYSFELTKCMAYYISSSRGRWTLKRINFCSTRLSVSPFDNSNFVARYEQGFQWQFYRTFASAKSQTLVERTAIYCCLNVRSIRLSAGKAAIKSH